eukprot:477660-Prorocentrum_lima.AAC.1
MRRKRPHRCGRTTRARHRGDVTWKKRATAEKREERATAAIRTQRAIAARREEHSTTAIGKECATGCGTQPPIPHMRA